MNIKTIALILSVICTTNAMQHQGEIPKATVLHKALLANDTDDALKFLENLRSCKDARITCEMLLAVNEHHQTALHIAIKQNNCLLVEALCLIAIEKKIFFALFRAQDIHNKTISDYARTNNNKKIRTLLQKFVQDALKTEDTNPSHL